jgi:hypothetical protein
MRSMVKEARGYRPDGSGAPSGPRNGNYMHGRHTKEVAATRRWLREAIHTLRELKKRP